MPRGRHLTLMEKATIIAERSTMKSFRQIGYKIDRSKSAVYETVKRTERDLHTIREKVIEALNNQGLTDITYANKCIELLNCKKQQIGANGKIDIVPDNQTQAKVLNTVKDIMGLDAVKQSEIKHTIELTPFEQDEIMIIRRKYSIGNGL